jgi:beta-xylosidase
MNLILSNVAAEENQTMHVVRLNREFTSPEQPMVEGATWARIFDGQSREAPALFKCKGPYYLITSACTGWAPNAANVAVADQILGPWKFLGNPCIGDGADTTFQSQSTFVLTVPGRPGDFIYMGDRWNKEDLANSRYVWLPMTVEDEKVVIANPERWDFSGFDRRIAR